MGVLIGREKQRRDLERLYQNKESAFVALYGRRRVGKTYLVNEVFGSRISFKHTGVSSAEFNKKQDAEILQIELDYFADSLKRYGAKLEESITSWRDAFLQLRLLIESMDADERKVIFIDEMPWLDTPNSLFVPAFAHFWNDFASARDDILLIVCGSATSWISNKILHNKADLYRRSTVEMKLEPFSLGECEELLQSSGFSWRRYQIAQAYMMLGGIPLYFKYLDAERTLEQNIDDLFFSNTATLREEFEGLFSSMFERLPNVEKIARVLAKRKEGFSRAEIAKMLGKKSGGDLTQALKALIESGFVLKYKSFRTTERFWMYKLIDPFCLFYLRFVEGHQSIDAYFWSKNFASGKVRSWQGNAFENLCFCHIRQIKRKMGIEGVSAAESLWSLTGKEDTQGAQIDLILERKDNVLNLCECKFVGAEYVVEKEDFEKASRQEDALAKTLSKRTIIQHVLITTFGLAKNKYSDLYKAVVTLDDLFALTK